MALKLKHHLIYYEVLVIVKDFWVWITTALDKGTFVKEKTIDFLYKKKLMINFFLMIITKYPYLQF